MRVSADADDPGHGPALHDVAAVLLNGRPVDHVITADENLGLLIRYCDGFPLCACGEAAMTQMLFGAVTVVLTSRQN